MSIRLRSWRAEQAIKVPSCESLLQMVAAACLSLHASTQLIWMQKEEEDARKLYDEFVESFGDEPEQKASKKSFTRGGVIQPGSSASSAGTLSLPESTAHIQACLQLCTACPGLASLSSG